MILRATFSFLSCLILASIFSTPALALTVTESFTSRSYVDSTGGMVWNTALGQLHPPLLVTNYDRGSGSEDYSFSVGDGSNGAFTTEAQYRALSCATVTGSEIAINTNTCDDLQFTTFHLLSGWTIKPVGTKPLRIRSLSTVIVDGVIDCSGANGSAGTSSVTASVTGAVGRCGGGNGGNSVLPNIAPGVANQGGSGGTSVTGGGGGLVQSATGGVGGGGGGGYVKNFSGGSDSPDGTSGRNDSAVVQANVGTNFRDDAFDTDVEGAGSGGGGGSGFELGADPGNSSGGSGGAGGGSILIYAVGNVTIAGSILADGGNGGSVSGVRRGGAGGGGAGGSILIMTVGDILIDTTGVVTAEGGFGGAASSTASGGNGDWGRTWLVEKDGYADYMVTPESPETKLNSPGDVRYETGVTYTVTSAAIDLKSTVPYLIDADRTLVAQGAATVGFEVAFGSSLLDSALSSFDVPTAYEGADIKRYARFQIVMDNADGLNPAHITDVFFQYNALLQNEFEFAGTCGTVSTLLVGGGAGGSSGSFGSAQSNGQLSDKNFLFVYFLLLAFPLILLFNLRRFKFQKFRVR